MVTFTAPKTVPCGMHTCLPNGKASACGGTCHIAVITQELVHYRCDRCSLSTARFLDGSPLPSWDGLLRDGSRYEDVAPDEHHWGL